MKTIILMLLLLAWICQGQEKTFDELAKSLNNKYVDSAFAHVTEDTIWQRAEYNFRNDISYTVPDQNTHLIVSKWRADDKDFQMYSKPKKPEQTDRYFDDGSSHMYDDLIKGKVNCVSDPNKKESTTSPITRQDLIDYFQECYNDSSAITIERFIFDTTKTKQKGYQWDYVIQKIDTLWIEHKDPTFPGFIKWMEKIK
jgi:hypothetical protein